jgi:hypothetical protein
VADAKERVVRMETDLKIAKQQILKLDEERKANSDMV